MPEGFEARLTPPASLIAASTMASSQPSQWASSRVRKAVISARLASPPAPAASSDRSHSVSKPIERLLMLAEPIRSSTSSMMVSLAWTMMVRPSVVTGL